MTSSRPHSTSSRSARSMAMFVADRTRPAGRASPTFTARWPAPRPTSPPGWPASGTSVGWVGRVGDDPFGRFTLTALAAAGIDTRTSRIDADAPHRLPAQEPRRRRRPRGRLLPQATPPAARLRLGPVARAEGYVGRARHLHVTGHSAGAVGQHPRLRLPAVDVARGRGRHRLVRPEPAARRCGPRPQEMVARGQPDGRAGRLGAARARAKGTCCTGTHRRRRRRRVLPRAGRLARRDQERRHGRERCSPPTGGVAPPGLPRARSSTRSGPATVSRPG